MCWCCEAELNLSGDHISYLKYLMMEEGASEGNPGKAAAVRGSGSGGAAEPKAALTEDVKGSGAELWKKHR